MQEINKWVEKKYKYLYRKMFISNFWFYTLNILSFAITAIMIIINLYSIKKNPFEDTKIYFVVLSILAGFVALLTSIGSFFTLRKNANIFEERYKEIDNEYKMWKSSKGKYNKADKDEIIVREVLNIYNKEDK